MEFPNLSKAALLNEPLAKHTVTHRELSALKPGEIGIKITATAINPVDWKMRDYKIFLTSYPAVLGSDAAGIITAIGSDVSGFKAGDRVFFQGIIGNYDSSTFQQYCKMPAELVAKTPDNISDQQAAGVGLATMAVVTAFYHSTGYGLIPPWEKEGNKAGLGKAIVILGGASSVGQYAIQLARLSGFSHIITNASSVNHEFLHSLGAHVVLDRSQSDAASFVSALGDVPLEFVFDAISAKSTQLLGVQIIQESKTQGSELVTVYTAEPEAIDADAIALGQSKEPKVAIKQIVGIGSAPDLRYLSEPMAKALTGWIASGLFIPNRPVVVSGGLDAVEEALAMNKQGVSGQKVVFCPWE